MTWLILVLATLACSVGETPPPEGPPVPEGPAPEVPPGAGADPDAVPGGFADARAEGLLDSAAVAYDAVELERALNEARRVLAEYPGSAAADSASGVAARAAFSLGRYTEARELAERYADGQPSGSDSAEEARALVELAADALASPSEAPAVIGAVLPRSGSRVLVRYGDMLLEGIELAVAEAERRQGRPVELVVADDEGGLRTGQAVEELERRGAVAIVGPLLPEQVSQAARARASEGLVMVSPTAPETRTYWPNVFSISAGDPRGARELGWYAAEAGLRQATVLHLGTAEYRRKAEAFASEFEGRGGVVRLTVAYDSGTTTFGDHLEQVMAAVGAAPPSAEMLGAAVYGDTLAAPVPGRPFALFVAAPERDVPQIAPQISFYGLDSAGVQVLGDDAWASAGVRRVVPARDLEGVIASSYYPPERADGVADPAFVQLYEGRYRRSLTNPLPALGYDAAHLVLQALPNRRLTPAAVARRFDLLAGIRGATGLLSVRSDRIIREPFLVQIRSGGLVPAPAPWEYPVPEVAPGTGSGGGR